MKHSDPGVQKLIDQRDKFHDALDEAGVEMSPAQAEDVGYAWCFGGDEEYMYGEESYAGQAAIKEAADRFFC